MAGGAAITVITKSGTNELHGSTFWFHDNQHLKARNFFLPEDRDKPLSIYNNYGATLGGPIVKDRLFYFFSYDGTRQREGSFSRYSVPTQDIRRGDYSAYLPVSEGGTCTASCAIVYDPLTGNPEGSGRTPFPNNIIPTNRLSPAALRIQDYLPAPNLAGLQDNYFFSHVPVFDRDYTDGKVNFNPSDNLMIWGRYGRMWANVGGFAAFGEAGGPSRQGPAPVSAIPPSRTAPWAPPTLSLLPFSWISLWVTSA